MYSTRGVCNASSVLQTSSQAGILAKMATMMVPRLHITRGNASQIVELVNTEPQHTPRVDGNLRLNARHVLKQLALNALALG
jgi:predicted oxidoreductase